MKKLLDPAPASAGVLHCSPAEEGFADAIIGWQKQHGRSEEHTFELQSRQYLVCRLLLEKKKNNLHDSRKTGVSVQPVKTAPGPAGASHHVRVVRRWFSEPRELYAYHIAHGQLVLTCVFA